MNDLNNEIVGWDWKRTGVKMKRSFVADVLAVDAADVELEVDAADVVDTDIADIADADTVADADAAVVDDAHVGGEVEVCVMVS